MSSEVANSVPKVPQPRVIKSCYVCHSRKVKCDAPTKGLPCTRCADRGETCILRDRQRRRIRPRSSLVAKSPQLPSSSPILELGSKINEPPRADVSTGSPSTVVTSEDGPWRAINYHNGIHYLSILNQAVSKDASKTADLSSESPGNESNNPRAGIEDLEPDDLDYLVRKGVFDLPPQACLDTLLKAYFEFVYPFAPVLDRIQFLKQYRSGCYSIFLMQAVLTSAISHVPESTISECEYATRAAAQQSFFSKASLLCDFGCERGQLSLLQGSLILGTAIIPRSKDKDVRYWFYKSVRLAVGMELHKSHTFLGVDDSHSRLYKRIWWVLYSRDILLSLFGTQNIRLLSDREYDVGLFTEQDWEVEQLFDQDSSILPVVSLQQKLYFVEYCKLAMIGTQCLSAVRDHLYDPQTLTQRLSGWRMALPAALVHHLQHPENICCTVLLAISYRFECILLRLLRTLWRRRDDVWHEWTRQRLHSAIFELDTIVGRAWSDGTLPTLPLSFKSCIHTALAVHIEMALDESESELSRSMSRLAIQRSVLILEQLKEDPAIQQALPIFERVLAQTNLMPIALSPTTGPSVSDLPTSNQCPPSQIPATSQVEPNSNGPILQDPFGEYSLWFKDFLGFDFLDR